jgi:hypothetical protein
MGLYRNTSEKLISGSGLQLDRPVGVREDRQGIGSDRGEPTTVPACRLSREAMLFTQSIGAAEDS